MIERPDITDWKELQHAVCRLLNEIGLTAQEERVLQTPRGSVAVDVYAVDDKSVDKIRYIVECKCWASAIPQHVVHSFTTVMNETGANIGFIVSKVGLQSGAEQYTNHTNILGVTFAELQQRYFDAWWKNYFCIIVAKHAEKVCFYTEPYNAHRDSALATLTISGLASFHSIMNDYSAFSMLMWHADLNTIAKDKGYGQPTPTSIEEFKAKIVEVLGSHLTFESVFWRDLLEEICDRFILVGEELDQLFGKDIFVES
ncbi:restriction endonuclease [Yersinia enterocolitica]|nr:restriction endonuclease [Yersinia enterocolitica]HDL8219790.1 restriction endonuclease [Yersinia enterocolitica]HDL8224241.1 restriction endonuclease [Yersinia enterocolitica]HEN3490876.1 restriction endonuclease [Yersinia enterocolitica]